MLNSFTFNGRTSTEFGIKVERMPSLNRSARKFRVASVSGHNGNIYELEDAFEEVIIPYQIFAGERNANGVGTFTDIVEWLHSANGYAVLTDTYDPTHYREAVFVDSLDIESAWHTLGRTTVNFRCRPERYLVGVPEAISNGSVVVNGTNHTAKPLITLTGTGRANFFNLDNRAAVTTTGTIKQFPADASTKYWLGANPILTAQGLELDASKVSSTTLDGTTGTARFATIYTYGLAFVVDVIPSMTYDLVVYPVDHPIRICTAYLYNHELLDTGAIINATADVHQHLPIKPPAECDAVLIIISAVASEYQTHIVEKMRLCLGYPVETLPFKPYGSESSTFTITHNQNPIQMTINTGFKTAVIDCDTENVLIEGQNGNLFTSITESGQRTANFLSLPKGSSACNFTNITAAVVKPNYWEL